MTFNDLCFLLFLQCQWPYDILETEEYTGKSDRKLYYKFLRLKKKLEEQGGKFDLNDNDTKEDTNVGVSEDKDVDKDELNEFMRRVALHSPMRKQVGYTNSPEVVSTDIVGSRHACVFDAGATIVNGNSVVMYLWYDNEFGYSCQVFRLLEIMAGVHYDIYPVEE